MVGSGPVEYILMPPAKQHLGALHIMSDYPYVQKITN